MIQNTNAFDAEGGLRAPGGLPCSKTSSILVIDSPAPARAQLLRFGGAFVSKIFRICAAILLCSSFVSAFAADLKDLIGRWRWQQFTIEVTQCKSDSICAKIIEGPKNVGMEVFASKLMVK